MYLLDLTKKIREAPRATNAPPRKVAMPDDYPDLDDVLLGHSDPPSDGSFDPFLPGLGQEGPEDDTDYFGPDDANESYYSDGVLRYGGFGSEGGTEFEPDDDRSIPWQGRTDQSAARTDEQRDREAADARDRHLRRVADHRSGGTGTGEARSGSAETMASSIADAQQRLGPGEPEFRATVNVGRSNFRTVGPKTNFTKNTRIVEPPRFEHAEFEATMHALRSNAGGSWTLQLIIDSSTVTDLKDAHGIALQVTVDRKSFSDGRD